MTLPGVPGATVSAPPGVKGPGAGAPVISVGATKVGSGAGEAAADEAGAEEAGADDAAGEDGRGVAAAADEAGADDAGAASPPQAARINSEPSAVIQANGRIGIIQAPRISLISDMKSETGYIGEE